MLFKNLSVVCKRNNVILVYFLYNALVSQFSFAETDLHMGEKLMLIISNILIFYFI